MTPRNKLARLPRELRQLALSLLLDGATAEDVRAALRAAGCAEPQLPGDNAFTAYRASAEFRSAHADWLALSQSARMKSLVATALADEGTEDAADVAMFACLQQADQFIRTGQDLNGNPVDVGAILRSVVAVKRQQADQRVTQLKARIADLEAQLAAAKGEQANAAGKPTVPREALLKKLDEYVLGGPKK